MKTFKVRFLSALLAVLMMASMLPLMFVTSNAAGAEQVTKTVNLFNSGATGSGKRYGGMTAQGYDNNPASNTFTNKGNDVYGYISRGKTLTIRMGLSFEINETVTEWAKLTVYAYDVDEESGETDTVYLVNETTNNRISVGTLSGRDGQWNTTTLEIDPDHFDVGCSYHFETKISDKRNQSTWWVYIRRVSIELTTATDVIPEPPVTEEPQITAHAFSASISNSGYITTNLEMTTDKDATYGLEYAAVIGAEQKGSALNQSISVTPDGTSKTVSFQLENNSPKGTYQINVIVSDAKGNTVTTYSTTAGYAYSAVTYNSNGGSSNVPKDTTAYSAGDTVKVRFDRTPYRSGYNFLGWSTSPNSNSPAAVEGGALFYFESLGGTSFTMSDSFGNSETMTASLNMASGKISFVNQYGTSYVFSAAVNGYTVAVTDKNGCTANAEIVEIVKAGALPTSVTVRVDPVFVIGNSDITLYAVWQEIPPAPVIPQYTVTYDANGGMGGPLDSLSYEIGQEVNVIFSPAPVRDGYNFLGWSIYPDTKSPVAVEGGTEFYFKNNGGMSFTVTDSFGNSETATAKLDLASNTVSFSDKYGTTYTFGRDGNVVKITVVDRYGCYASAEITGLEMDVTGQIPSSATVKIYPKFNMGESDVTLYAIWEKKVCYIHDYRLVENKATCTEPGEVLYRCAECGYEIMDWSSALGHDYVYIKTQAPTCLEEGYDAYECSRCQDSYTASISKLAHVEGTHSTTKQPTCTEEGRWTALCELCKTELNGYLPPVGHHVVTNVIKQVTCTEAGIIEHACDRDGCDYSYVEYIYSEHNFVLNERVEPTCTVDGKIVYQCTNCGEERIEVITGGHQYEGKVTKPATVSEEGIMTYTCVKCGNAYIETIPQKAKANILLVEDRLPWSEAANTKLLNNLTAGGYISAWTKTTTANLANLDLALYDVIYIANDQTTATYNQLKKFNEMIEAFARKGGIVVYGACDQGWAGGSISYALPGGVTKGNYYSYRNYISNYQHDIVTGVLTDGKELTNALLYSTYSSHTYFTNLPADATTILTDANGKPTLVEYPLGNGYIIASGLTWEYTFVRNYVNGTSFAKTVYDDMLVYATSLICAHDWITAEVVAPNCTEGGYTLHSCNKCGATRKTDFVPEGGHQDGEWIVNSEPTMTEPGVKSLMCAICGMKIREELIPCEVHADVTDEHGSHNASVVVGDYITFIVKIENADLAKNLGIEWSFDQSVFTYEEESYEFLIDSFIQNFEENTFRAAFAWKEPTNINVQSGVFALTLKATGVTKPNTTTVTCRVLLENGKIEIKVIPVTVTVTGCMHTVTYTEDLGDYHAIRCEHCDFTLKTEAHSYSNCCDDSCNGCDHVRVAPHNTFIMDAVAPTCTVAGLTEGLKCKECGKILVKQESIPPIPHTVISIPAVEATCTVAGLTEGEKCSVCDTVLKAQKIVPAKGHTEVIIPGIPATCEKNGLSEGLKCSVCETVLSKPIVDRARGHNYKSTVTPSTCTEKGCITYKCNNLYCDRPTYTEELPPLDHSFAAEWENDMMAHWHTCVRCGAADQRVDHVYDAASDGGCDECGHIRFIRGDMDQDGDVDSDDAIYLLYYVMFKGVGYPINQPADMDGNDKANVDDAIYLLNSIIFGDTDYPLF